MNQPKPGYLTTEFWAMIANTVLSVLVVFNILSQPDADQIYALTTPLITAVLGIITYTISRTVVKRSA